MQTFNQFKQTRKLKVVRDKDTWCYGVHGTWQITEEYPQDIAGSVFIICGEEFKTLADAEECLYNMYCDEEMLTEGY